MMTENLTTTFKSMKNTRVLKNFGKENGLDQRLPKQKQNTKEENDSTVPGAKKSFKCSICTVKYSQKIALINHISSVHHCSS